MGKTSTKQKMAENEAVFRKLNQRLVDGVKDNELIAQEDNQPEFTVMAMLGNQPINFFCECSDEKCTKRVKITLRDYTAINAANDQFVIAPGHETPSIERVVMRHDPQFVVVKKLVPPPADAETLHPTNLHNN